jgi:hypothetical protein
MRLNLKKCIANGLIMGVAIFILERYFDVNYWVAFGVIFVTCTLTTLIGDFVFPDKKSHGGKFLIDESHDGRIICRVQFDNDPLDYKDGETVYLKVEMADYLDKGVDINA